MDAEFIGLGRGGWPAMTVRRSPPYYRPSARNRLPAACLRLVIGNSDMHPGNLSFVTDSGRPYELAPAYDMRPIAFAPRSSSELPATATGRQFRQPDHYRPVAPDTAARPDLSGALE